MVAEERISGVILAGGKSKRLGMDKALLGLGGRPLIASIVEKLRQLSDDILVVGEHRDLYDRLNVRSVEDVYPGHGALGGIYSGLRASRFERALVVAYDMPFLDLRLLRYMILLGKGYDVLIPRTPQGTEPLHAIYSKRCIKPIGELISASGTARIVHFFDRVRVRYVEPNEIALFDPHYLSFFNINTPKDLARAREITATQGREDVKAQSAI